MAMSWCVGVCGVSLHALIHTQTSTHTHMSECEYVLCKLPEWTSDVCTPVHCESYRMGATLQWWCFNSADATVHFGYHWSGSHVLWGSQCALCSLVNSLYHPSSFGTVGVG